MELFIFFIIVLCFLGMALGATMTHTEQDDTEIKNAFDAMNDLQKH